MRCGRYTVLNPAWWGGTERAEISAKRCLALALQAVPANSGSLRRGAVLWCASSEVAKEGIVNLEYVFIRDQWLSTNVTDAGFGSLVVYVFLLLICMEEIVTVFDGVNFNFRK